MVRYAAILLSLAPACYAAEAQQAAPAQPANHQEFATALLELLTQTEQCLASCVDEASVEAALPSLQELAQQARRLSAWQRALPEPTVQDYMAAHPQVGSFNRIWQAIGDHIERLEQAKLVSPALREVLHLAPES